MGKKNFAPAVAVPGDISLADIDLWLCFKIAPVLILNFLFDVYQVLRWNVTLEIPEMWSVRKPNIVCRTLFTLRAVLLQTPSPSGSPRRWPTGCSFWDSRRRHRCTSASFGTHRGCRGTSSGTEPRSKTCCVAASLPSCPSPLHPAWTQTSRIAGGSCTWTGAMCIQYREQAHASPVAVEEVSLKGRSAGFLIVPVTLGFVLIVPVSDIYILGWESLPMFTFTCCSCTKSCHVAPRVQGTPNRSQPGCLDWQKFGRNLSHLATLILADHVVAASILLNGGSTLHWVNGESSSAFSIYDATFWFHIPLGTPWCWQRSNCLFHYNLKRLAQQ